jgi:nitroreductase
MLRDLITKNRSYRRFYSDYSIKIELLTDLIDLARLSSSASNKQPLKYILSIKKEINEQIFSCLSWAGYLKNWDGPADSEKPSGYIVILGDQIISTEYLADPGIACQSILLGAVEQGLGGCILASVDRNKLRKLLNITEQYEILYVIAIGKPQEEVIIEETDEKNDIKYWRDQQDRHHVPKRPLKKIILQEYR